MILVYIIMFLFTALISFIWVRGIDNMAKNYPKYKGNDFLNEKEEDDEKEENTMSI
jgi:hypothetical protein